MQTKAEQVSVVSRELEINHPASVTSPGHLGLPTGKASAEMQPP